MIEVEFYVECFDRHLILMVKPGNEDKALKICQKAYEDWFTEEGAEFECCEEYICEKLCETGVEFIWID